MGVRAVGLAVLLVIFTVTSSSAMVRIENDRGGRIGTYIEAYSVLRNSGERVVIDGPCLSACTLIVGMIPHDRVCVTNRAQLGFHAAWLPDRFGRPTRSSMGTQVLMDVYPPKVRSWIRRKGGLSRHMIFLRGRELLSMYRPCP